MVSEEALERHIKFIRCNLKKPQLAASINFLNFKQFIYSLVINV